VFILNKNLLHNQSTNFNQTNGAYHPWMKRIKDCSKEGPDQILFQGEIVTEMQK
jgi:hypothetical protein